MTRTKGASLVRTHVAVGLEAPAARTTSAAMRGAVIAHPTLIQTLTNGIEEMADLTRRSIFGEPIDLKELMALRARYVPVLQKRPGDPMGGILHDALASMLSLHETDSMRDLRHTLIRAAFHDDVLIDHLHASGIKGDCNLLGTLTALEPARNFIANGTHYQRLLDMQFHNRPQPRSYTPKSGAES